MYPTTFYRVAIKALIKNKKGEVLVVKESPGFWDLPGGGLEHDESPEDCIKRELAEELGVSSVNVKKVKCAKSLYLDRMDIWMIWIVYEVELDEDATFKCADGVVDVKYVDIEEFTNSDNIFEKSMLEVVRQSN